jgi:hypothetical protein
MGLFDFLRSEKRGDNFLKAVFGGYGAANRTAVTRDTSLTFNSKSTHKSLQSRGG